MPTISVAVLRQVAYAVVLTATLNSRRVYAAPESFSPVGPVNVCPGETTSFTCTVVDSSRSSITVWTGTAFDNFDCGLNVIVLLHEEFQSGMVGMCSDGDVVAHATGVDGDCYTSNLTAVLSPQLDGTTIQCQLTVTTIGSPYTLTVAGPPTAPTMVGVEFPLPRQQFAIQWDSAPVVSEANITGFSLSIQSPGGLMCDDISSVSNATESLCSWEASAVSQVHTFTVSALNCDGTQEGASSDSVGVTLQVPVAPILTVYPVYDQSTGELLRIESSSTIVPAVDIAAGVDGSPDAYIFSYNGASQSVVSSGQCTGGTCTDEFTPDPAVSQYTVSVTARNVVGEGPPDTAGPFNAANVLLELEIDVNSGTVRCMFLGGFTGTAAECQIEYSTQEDLSGSVVDTGSSTSGDSVAVTLTATLERSSTYYYIVTATAEGVTVRVEGFFNTDCPASELGKVDADLNQNCPGDSAGSVRISAGRACYAGTAPGATAEYDCNCPQYRLEGTGTRICQNDGTWSGTVPQCLPQCNLIPSPTNRVTHFVVPDCSPDGLTVRATYGCGLNKDSKVVQFSTPADGNCQWPDPPCEVSEVIAGIIGPVLYAFMAVAMFCLAMRILVKVKVNKWLLATALAMCLILPPVGIALAWWLTYSKQAPSTDNRTFVWTRWKVAIAVGGGILWLVNLIIWIVLAILFGPLDAFPSNSEYGLLVAGLILAIVTLVYCLVMVAMGLGVPTRKKAWQGEDMSMKEKASYGPVGSLGFKPPVPMPEDSTTGSEAASEPISH